MLWCHQILEMSPYKIWVSLSIIYVMIAKNIRYLRWNEGAWHSFHNTYQTFLNLCIRCTDDLLSDSCCLTDVNPHFIPSPLWRKISKCWPIVTSSIHEPVATSCDVTMTDCSHAVSMDTFLSQWRWCQWVLRILWNTRPLGFQWLE